MNFGEALEELKQGRHVARKGWNGKGMHIELWDLDHLNLEKFLTIKNIVGSFNTWVPSISDLLAGDWVIVK